MNRQQIIECLQRHGDTQQNESVAKLMDSTIAFIRANTMTDEERQVLAHYHADRRIVVENLERWRQLRGVV